MRDSKSDTDVKNSLLDSVVEGKGRMIWENGIETCIISYVKQIASPALMHDTGCLSPEVLSCNTLCLYSVHTKFGINIVTSRAEDHLVA